MIAHSDSTLQRIFPPIQPDLYEVNCNLAELTPDQRAAQKIITLANRNFTRWERLVGWKLDSIGQIDRLLLQHRLAMEAELSVQRERADFFWNQVLIELKALSRRHKVWQVLASTISVDEPGVVVMGDRLQLRQRLVDELLIDTHFAFYNGLTSLLGKLSLKDRAFVHIDYIQKLFDLSDISNNRLFSVLDKPWQQQLNLCQEAGKWTQAIEICNKRLKYFPMCVKYQDELAEVHFLATLAQLETINCQEDFLGIEPSRKKTRSFHLNSSSKENDKSPNHWAALVLGGLLALVIGSLLQIIPFLYYVIVGVLLVTLVLLPVYLLWFILVKTKGLQPASPAKNKDRFSLLYSALSVTFTLLGGVLIENNPLLLLVCLGVFFVILVLVVPVGLVKLIKVKAKRSRSASPATVSSQNAGNSDSTGFFNFYNPQKTKNFSIYEVEAEHLQNATRLQGGIDNLEKLSKKYPYSLTILELLGHLHHLRAISLGNASHLSKALVAIQKALTYHPYLEKAFETRNQLVEMMQQLQAYMREVAAQLARELNVMVKLNKEGQHLRTEVSQGFNPINVYSEFSTNQATTQAFNVLQTYSLCKRVNFTKPSELASEASKGFAAVNAYIESSAAQVIAQSFKIAQAYSVWQSIGLTEPAEGWTEQVLLLLDVLDCIFSNPPANKADLANIFHTLVLENLYLAELDTELIHTFIQRKLFRSEQELADSKTLALSRELPVLIPRYTKLQPGAEPFIPWLFSRQDIRLKFQAVVAIVLVLTAGMLTAQDLCVRSARNITYQQILEAQQRQDLLGVVKGAEEFFDKTPLSGKDQRDRQVMELYSEALVRWVTQQGNPLDEEAKVHLKRYQTVRNNLKQGGN